MLCVGAVCSLFSTVLSLACPHTRTPTEGQVCLCVCESVLSVHMLERAHVCPWHLCLCGVSAVYLYVIVSRQVQFVLSWEATLVAPHRTLRPTNVLPIEGRGLGCHGNSVLQSVSWEAG